MSSEYPSKINRLLKRWPPGTVAVLPWLKEQGVYQQLADKYVASGWLDRLGHGAYVRADERPDWKGGLYAIQHQLGLPVHVAAGTALELLGSAHFLAVGQGRRVALMAPPGVKLPAWFRQHDWGGSVEFFASRLFLPDDELNVTERAFGTYENRRYPSTYGGGYPLKLSTAERAVMEVCARVPRDYSYEEANHLMEGLPTLRPHRVQALLERCTSVKAKRLFLHLAERSGHAWLPGLDLARMDLGSGKRMLIKGGRLDRKYLITVPREGEQ